MSEVKRTVRYVIQQQLLTGEWFDCQLTKTRDVNRAREILANYRREVNRVSTMRIVRRETVRTDTPVTE